jgi:hypothetical protein
MKSAATEFKLGSIWISFMFKKLKMKGPLILLSDVDLILYLLQMRNLELGDLQ